MHSNRFAAFRFYQLSLNKPTPRQLLKVSNEQLKTALENIKAMEELTAALQLQLSDRDQHIGSLQQIIGFLNQALAENETIITDLESRNTLLERANSLLSEKVGLQDAIIAQMQQLIDQKDHLIARQDKELGKLDLVRHGKKLDARMLYGRKSEKTHEPPVLPDVFGKGLTAEELAEAKDVFTKTGFARIEKEPIPDLMAQGIPVRTTIVKMDNVPPGTRIIGQKTTRRLVYHKAWTEIHEIIRYIYMQEDKENIRFKNITEPLPVRPLKCKADISLTKQILIDRYMFHIPVKRMLIKLNHAGARVPYSTFLDWANTPCHLLGGLHELQMRELIKNRILHCDETGLTVIDKTKKIGKKSHRGQLFGMLNPLQGIVAFKYMKSRGHDEIGALLRGFTGYLHTDGYTGYNKFGSQPGVQHGRCMAHCRRYFFNAKETDFKRAHYVLKNFINPLYAIEQRCRDENLEFDQITEMRGKYAVPVLNAFHAWLLEHQQKVKPHTPIAKAIEYILRLWDGVMLYTTDGMLQIDNNCLERQIRPIALGKKSWMFAGSHEAAPNAAIMFTFFGTCQLQGIDPEEWLDDVLNRIATTPKHQLADLLPQNWRRRRKAVA